MSRVFEIGGERSADVSDSAVVDRVYAAIGYDTEAEVVAAVSSYLTTASLTTIGGMFIDRMSPKEFAESNWKVAVHWAPFRTREPTPSQATGSTTWSEPEFNFEFSTAAEKIFVPIGTQTVYQRSGASGSAPAIALIGDQGDGKPPSGVDLMTPMISFGETRYLRQAAFTETARNDLLRLLGKVNSTSFRGWDPGEVLFVGCSGRARGRDDIEMNFRYQVRQNKSITVPGFSSIDLLGWEYLWPRHKRIYDGTAVKTTAEIELLVVAQVYEDTSFSSLE